MTSAVEVSLAQYAAVNAAVAEGFLDDDALSAEGLAPQAFRSADAHWKLRLVNEPPTFATNEQELAAAQDRLDRDVTPLRTDLAAWLAFLDAYAAHPKPFEMLQASMLGMHDIARLGRAQ